MTLSLGSATVNSKFFASDEISITATFQISRALKFTLRRLSQLLVITLLLGRLEHLLELEALRKNTGHEQQWECDQNH